MNQLNRFILVLIIFVMPQMVIGQKEENDNQEVPEQENDAFEPIVISPVEGLKEGYYSFSIGFNFDQFVSKNQDEFIYFVLDDKELRYNIKLGFGYQFKDLKSFGIGLRYYYDQYDVEYENAVGDTIVSTSLDRRITTNLFYGISKPLFGSKRVFMIGDPSLFFTYGTGETTRQVDLIEEFAESRLYAISVGLNVGIQAFLNQKLSAQVSIGPVGVGYRWEEFTLDGVPNGNNESFFARMSPDLFNFEFSISRYF